jgi:hypothetical protein
MPPEATYLDVILYRYGCRVLTGPLTYPFTRSREQITAENIAMGSEPPTTTAPWGIISVKGQHVAFELPMQPITMMRNALGKDEGGSGVPLVRELYARSVEFWTQHATIK